MLKWFKLGIYLNCTPYFSKYDSSFSYPKGASNSHFPIILSHPKIIIRPIFLDKTMHYSWIKPCTECPYHGKIVVCDNINRCCLRHKNAMLTKIIIYLQIINIQQNTTNSGDSFPPLTFISFIYNILQLTFFVSSTNSDK